MLPLLGEKNHSKTALSRPGCIIHSLSSVVIAAKSSSNAGKVLLNWEMVINGISWVSTTPEISLCDGVEYSANRFAYLETMT